MTRRDRLDATRDDWRWDDIAIAVITVGSLVAAWAGWI